ncbi:MULTISPECIES: SDR family NAD(P)-dependent oxidoreductase [unclassified Polaromonas]|jgi:NAD(P)-dependent dehydrogenase (short-subunit alcohol dehydrogenase family)|uniref:SDR family NAD(P)-dependent oxidoreductase n=1 Tax=unclassified Polaromonas TaxID=2638319 RepID=UPI000BCACAF1|nr:MULTISPECIES: SDR family NAD(P)-dependent oxidoreductase [unclassified Polaromonas]OYY32004.1 MAG: hypothetical protein B7Y60_23660 [Polaromonas sp. 35-63-35]OYZ75406.1 MAG: hypothetical protein B7Y09_24390 [Polaromonas sp. 24-63-21]OZA45585.1 MAG: hypothetical protein B7X88_24395 [Polaromonas sp. 17-63-33]OZA85037.1 MAG: hypothetical protein B7X65_23235 [Polaromonas sp. 39-63-25]
MENLAAGEVSLHGKVVLVTGGAQGIGQAIARLAQQCGAQIVSCDLKPITTGGQAAQEMLNLVGDVSREEDCARFVQDAVTRFGRLDVVVNSAGLLEKTRRTVKQDLATWKQIIDVNLQGTYLMSRAAAATMIAADRPGSIINIASITGLVGFRASNAYGVSKAAVAMLTKTLAVDLASRNIRVNAVAPGLIATAMTAELRHTTGVEDGAFLDRIPMQRFGDSDEVARAAVFLGSDWASYITGVVLPVDGGWSAFGGPGNAQ